MTDLLDLQQVSVRFGGLVALREATLTVGAGEIHALIGPNGAGKSTLVNCVTGYQRPSGGSITVCGRSTRGLRPARVARLGVARTFQTPQLFGRLSTVENIAIAAIHRATPESSALLLLERVGISKRADLGVTDLAYGEQRLVEVARALVRDPPLLLLDEPAAGLAATEIERLAGVLRGFVADRAKGILIIEHNVALVRALAHRISVLHEGEIIASGPPAHVLGDARVVAAYLGTSRSVMRS